MLYNQTIRNCIHEEYSCTYVYVWRGKIYLVSGGEVDICRAMPGKKFPRTGSPLHHQTTTALVVIEFFCPSGLIRYSAICTPGFNANTTLSLHAVQPSSLAKTHCWLESLTAWTYSPRSPSFKLSRRLLHGDSRLTSKVHVSNRATALRTLRTLLL